ncbi:MAG: hypothetical protein ABJM43_09080 [Paracoccaceae bacterium]
MNFYTLEGDYQTECGYPKAKFDDREVRILPVHAQRSERRCFPNLPLGTIAAMVPEESLLQLFALLRMSAYSFPKTNRQLAVWHKIPRAQLEFQILSESNWRSS